MFSKSNVQLSSYLAVGFGGPGPRSAAVQRTGPQVSKALLPDDMCVCSMLMGLAQFFFPISIPTRSVVLDSRSLSPDARHLPACVEASLDRVASSVIG